MYIPLAHRRYKIYSRNIFRINKNNKAILFHMTTTVLNFSSTHSNKYQHKSCVYFLLWENETNNLKYEIISVFRGRNKSSGEINTIQTDPKQNNRPKEDVRTINNNNRANGTSRQIDTWTDPQTYGPHLCFANNIYRRKVCHKIYVCLKKLQLLLALLFFQLL